jgi:hypothetical protein
VFKAVFLEILAEVALMAVQDKQLVPLKTKRIISPAVLRDWDLPIARYICLLVSTKMWMRPL